MTTLGSTTSIEIPAEVRLELGNFSVTPEGVVVRHPEVDGRINPVVIEDLRPDLNAPNVLLASAWSAGMEMPYQRVRVATLAKALGVRVFAPNTIGQSIGSPDLLDEERAELREGRAQKVGAFMVQSAFDALEYSEDVPDSVHIVATSQGPLVVPAMMKELNEQSVSVETVTLFTPASTYLGGRLSLIWNMVTNGGKKMKEYRSHNPEFLITKVAPDTNIVKSLWTQFRAHVIDFPRAMARQGLADQMAEATLDMEQKPRVVVIDAEKDKVSKRANNELFVARLRELGFETHHATVLGEHHAMTEHVPFIANLIGQVIRTA